MFYFNFNLLLTFNIRLAKSYRNMFNSQVRGALVIIAKTNAILKRSMKKLFIVENTYRDTNQTDKAKGQKLR